jgi:hypothetical protein
VKNKNVGRGKLQQLSLWEGLDKNHNAVILAVRVRDLT